ncbi:MAG: hypothetical protein JWQ24_2959 [Tardiphaga sp.]|nr:hypothetical protein [Tardiphaga sp.]
MRRCDLSVLLAAFAAAGLPRPGMAQPARTFRIGRLRPAFAKRAGASFGAMSVKSLAHMLPPDEVTA